MAAVWSKAELFLSVQRPRRLRVRRGYSAFYRYLCIKEGFNLFKPYVLTRNNDFRRLYRSGKSYASPLIVTYVCKGRPLRTRIGITASRKIGNAVKRNRARRLVRESYRILKPKIKPGFDIVFVCRGKTPYVKCQDVLKHMEKQLISAGAIESANL